MRRIITLFMLCLLSAQAHAAIVTYEMTINNLWDPASFPIGFPSEAHFSWLGGGTHNANASFWQPGSLASPGMVQMAESGNVSKLADIEVQNAIDAGDAFSKIFEKIYTPEIPPGPGSRVTTFQMSSDYPLLTLATMLGPSPDWFVGVSGLELYANGVWKNNYVVDLALYDGGTRGDLVPHMGGPLSATVEPIHLIAYDPASGNYIPSLSEEYVGSLEFRLLTPVPLPAAAWLFASVLIAALGYAGIGRRRRSVRTVALSGTVGSA